MSINYLDVTVIRALVDLFIRIALNRQALNVTAEPAARQLLTALAHFEHDGDVSLLVSSINAIQPTALKRK